jgi:hypothetical protein
VYEEGKQQHSAEIVLARTSGYGRPASRWTVVSQ